MVLLSQCLLVTAQNEMKSREGALSNAAVQDQCEY